MSKLPARLEQPLVVLDALAVLCPARLPEKYTGWSDRVKEAVSVDVTALFLPVQCVSFSLRLIAYALSPVGLIALLLLLGEGGGR